MCPSFVQLLPLVAKLVISIPLKIHFKLPRHAHTPSPKYGHKTTFSSLNKYILKKQLQVPYFVYAYNKATLFLKNVVFSNDHTADYSIFPYPDLHSYC